MAARANPAVNKNGPRSKANGPSTRNKNVNNGRCSAVPVNFSANTFECGLTHNIEPSLEWTRDEQSLLEELLTKYASHGRESCYAMIAEQLKTKRVRDVAFRCLWMTQKEKEYSKRRREDNGSSRKQIVKRRRKKVAEQPATHRANGLSHAPSPASVNGNDNISYKVISGSFMKLLEQNAQAMDQISANFSAIKVHENVDLFAQTRNNIIKLMNDFKIMPEVMKGMPPLAVKLNNELASSILPLLSMPR